MSSTLPDEVNLLAFSYLTTLKDLISALGVCREWRRLAADHSLAWRDITLTPQQALLLTAHHNNMRLRVKFTNELGMDALLNADPAHQSRFCAAVEKLHVEIERLKSPSATAAVKETQLMAMLGRLGNVRHLESPIAVPEWQKFAPLATLENLSLVRLPSLTELVTAWPRVCTLRVMIGRQMLSTGPNAMAGSAPDVQEFIAVSGLTSLLETDAGAFPNLRKLTTRVPFEIGSLAAQLTSLDVTFPETLPIEKLAQSAPFSSLVTFSFHRLGVDIYAQHMRGHLVDGDMRVLLSLIRDMPHLHVLKLGNAPDVSVSTILGEIHQTSIEVLHISQAISELTASTEDKLATAGEALFGDANAADGEKMGGSSAGSHHENIIIDWRAFWSRLRPLGALRLNTSLSARTNEGWRGVAGHVYGWQVVVDARISDAQRAQVNPSCMTVLLRRCLWPTAK